MTEIKLNNVGEYVVDAEGLIIQWREWRRDDAIQAIQMSFGMDADTAASLLDDVNGEYFRFEGNRIVPIKEYEVEALQEWWAQQDQDEDWIEEMSDG